MIVKVILLLIKDMLKRYNCSVLEIFDYMHESHCIYAEDFTTSRAFFASARDHN